MSDEGIPETEPEANEKPPSGANYHDRIRSEGDFAVGEVQKKDSYIGELHTKVNTYKPLDQYIQAAGSAEELIQLAIEGSQARQNATQQPTQKTPAQEEQEIYDPEIKAINEKYEQRFASQEALLRSMQTQLTSTSASAVKGALTENIGTALSDFSAFPELETKAREVIMGAVEVSERLAKAGNTSAAQNLEQLADPQKGPAALQMMLSGMYREMALAGRQATNDESNGKAKSRSTDAPSGMRSMLDVDDVTVEAGTRVSANTVREVMEQLAVKWGKDPRTLFG